MQFYSRTMTNPRQSPYFVAFSYNIKTVDALLMLDAFQKI